MVNTDLRSTIEFIGTPVNALHNTQLGKYSMAHLVLPRKPFHKGKQIVVVLTLFDLAVFKDILNALLMVHKSFGGAAKIQGPLKRPI